MAARCKRGQAGEDERIVAVEPERPLEDAFGPGEIRGVGGLASPLLVRESEERERASIRGALAHGLLQPRHRPRGVAEREAGEGAVVGDYETPNCVSRVGRAPRGRRVAEDTPEQGDEGGENRRRRPEAESRLH